jgi:hypothetical protein
MRLIALSALVATLVCAERSYADCTTPVTSPCVNSDTLWPHAGPSDFLSVGGSETVQASRIAFGLVASYLSQPIVIASPSPGSSGSNRPAVDNEINATFLFAYGITEKLELDLALPVTIFQDGDGTAPITGGPDVPTTATRDLRFGATYTLLGRPKKHPWRHDASGFGLAARFEMTAPSGDADAFSSEPSAVYVPSLALDYRSHRFFFAGELGARIRPTTDFLGARIGTQGVIAGGVGVDVLDQHDLLSVTGELRFLPVFTEQATVTQTVSGLQSSSNGTFITPAEWMVTARTAPLEGGDLTIQLGVGGWFPTASFAPITVPRFRAVLGLTFAPRGRDTDGDGVPDATDRCPLEPGPKNSEDGAGCPPKIETTK